MVLICTNALLIFIWFLCCTSILQLCCLTHAHWCGTKSTGRVCVVMSYIRYSTVCMTSTVIHSIQYRALRRYELTTTVFATLSLIWYSTIHCTTPHQTNASYVTGIFKNLLQSGHIVTEKQGSRFRHRYILLLLSCLFTHSMLLVLVITPLGYEVAYSWDIFL